MSISWKTDIKILKTYGDYNTGVPPLPIPNREVKPGSADGTASSGRVGRRRSSESLTALWGFRFLYRSGFGF